MNVATRVTRGAPPASPAELIARMALAQASASQGVERLEVAARLAAEATDGLVAALEALRRDQAELIARVALDQALARWRGDL